MGVSRQVSQRPGDTFAEFDNGDIIYRSLAVALALISLK